jgi:cytochrome c-type protein NapC
MNFKKQQKRPQRKHPKAMKQGKTCIDCHKGIAHKLPEGYEEED